MLHDQIIAAIRTGCAVLGAAIVTWLIGRLPGVELDPQTGTTLGVVLAAIAVAVYNVAVNLLATKVHPIFGVLLGVPKTPSYDNGKVIAGSVVPADERIGEH